MVIDQSTCVITLRNYHDYLLGGENGWVKDVEDDDDGGRGDWERLLISPLAESEVRHGYAEGASWNAAGSLVELISR